MKTNKKRFKDYVGEKFGSLKIVGYYSEKTDIGRYRYRFKCVCDCDPSTIVDKDANHVINGKTYTCGNCNKRDFEKYIGERIGDLLIVGFYSFKDKNYYRYMFICICNCNPYETVDKDAYNVISGKTQSCGCKQGTRDHTPLLGVRFGKLVPKEVVRQRLKTKVQIRYLCQCDCGNPELVSVKKSDLEKGDRTHCGCKRFPTNRYTDRFHAIFLHHYHSSVVKRSKQLGYTEIISFEEFKYFIQLPCHYCGDPFSAMLKDRDSGRKLTVLPEATIWVNGLDRVNNKKGYNIHNIVPCCTHCNKAKGELSYEEFRALISKLFRVFVLNGGVISERKLHIPTEVTPISRPLRLNRTYTPDEMIGKTFGWLTVLSYERQIRPSGQSYIKLYCQCVCGTPHTADKFEVNKGNIISCGCFNSLYIKSKHQDRVTAIMRTLYKKVQSRSKNVLGLNNMLSFEVYCSLITQPCFYCGEPHSNAAKDLKDNKTGQHRTDTIVLYNGLDRKDGTYGYTEDNVLPCCRNCNLAKFEKNIDEFRQWIIQVNDYWNEKVVFMQ
ncbi:hypothetical protein HPT25_14330 [Bacillus sp. BRMEA1]|uniref:hypothetical protein n=1 Tax=Neobacillus endophyticus TaxID=2738405 RepID=UPI0015671DBD|nr:hypothetical protein [Neobacillus endophyticus]NRD78539.1 hypothetical protein [Neobacillus endophyticus]